MEASCRTGVLTGRGWIRYSRSWQSRAIRCPPERARRRSPGQYLCRRGQHHGLGGVVHVFDPQGKPLATWGGGPGSGDGQFNYITALAVDEQGNVYVADFENARIQKFDALGQFLTQWPTESPAGPTGLAVDSAG